jgi:hypothetical protein
MPFSRVLAVVACTFALGAVIALAVGATSASAYGYNTVPCWH